jgi:alpha-galactosidase
MIAAGKHVFFLETQNTSYWIRVNHAGILETLYYGRKIRQTDSVGAVRDKHFIPCGSSLSYSKEYPTINLNNMCVETSTPDNGDFRESSLIVEYGKRGTVALNMLYKSHRIFMGKPRTFEGLPESYGDKRTCSTLEITLIDEGFPFALLLYYTVFEDSDVIARHSVFVNNSPNPVLIRNIASLQFDLFDGNWNMISFDGAWARERHIHERPVMPGIAIVDSKTGVSSASHNPLVYLKRPSSTEDSGDCYAFNLIYSGNHREVVEKNEYDKIRFMTGINPATFSWTLATGDRFQTPEAVMTFSYEGLNGASSHFQKFINLHIVRGSWKLRERPVLLNNWEATYFHFNDSILENLATEASKLGIELFVLDDGWFGAREDDTSSLGDWFPNTRKLSGGLQGLSRKVHELGLMFGVWVEPEMISEQSELFEKHPGWRVSVPDRVPKEGRHQFILDLTQSEVRRYLIETLVNLLRDGEVDYVKWDMNRVFSDVYSDTCSHGEFNHRYCMGLYEVLKKVTENCPNILFESCSSGGNRFDLGMMCFMPQAWCSDNTDALCRTEIQKGTSFGYPLSCTGAHVSASPNHQTLRVSDLESRFNVACFGDLGYEMDLCSLSTTEKAQIKAQIEFYKDNRPLLQYGQFLRIESDPNRYICAVANKDRSEMIVLDFQKLNTPNGPSQVLRIPFANPDYTYAVVPRTQKIPVKKFGTLINMISPVKVSEKSKMKTVIADKIYLKNEIEHYLVPGDMLAYAGIKLFQEFGGTGFNDCTRVMGDFDSRLYYICKVDESKKQA